MNPLFPPPSNLLPPASDAQKLFDAQKYPDTISFTQENLAALEKQLPARASHAHDAAAGSVAFQYYALTLILVNALAQLEEWKPAKEVLGKYRVRFPRDPWGFRAGAEVTRRDPNVNDQAAVQRAAELLEGEAARLEAAKPGSPPK